MIGDHPVRGLVGALRCDPGRVRHRLDERAEQIRIVVRVHALQDRRHALKAHAGIDGGLWQVDPVARLDLLVLHEDEVPEFEEPVAVLVRAAGRAALQGIALIDEDLGARTARPGIAHLPEIVGGRDADDLGIGKARDFLPQRHGFLVVVIDGDEEPVLGQPELLGDQVPGELDGAVLEVIAKREIPHHLEEGVVPGGVADIVEIVVLAAGAHAFLGRGGTVIRALLGAREHVLELHHARIGEHERRIVARHERARRHLFVAVLRKVIEEGRPDFVDAAHDTLNSGTGLAGAPEVGAKSCRSAGFRRRRGRCREGWSAFE